MKRRFFRGARGLRFWQAFPRRRARVRSGGGQAREAHISFTQAVIEDDAIVGATVGVLSVAHNADAFTYSLTDDAGGQFAVDGSDIEVASALTAGEHSITVEADDGAGLVLTASFVVTVSEAA